MTSALANFVILLISVYLAQGKHWTSCPDGWVAYNGSCYYFSHHALHFTEAEHYCHQHDGHLIHVNENLENSFVKDRLRYFGKHDWWMGLTDELIEGVFQWYDTDTTVTYSDWATREPDNLGEEECVSFSPEYDFHWNDIPCTRNNVFVICEIEVGTSDSFRVFGR